MKTKIILAFTIGLIAGGFIALLGLNWKRDLPMYHRVGMNRDRVNIVKSNGNSVVPNSYIVSQMMSNRWVVRVKGTRDIIKYSVYYKDYYLGEYQSKWDDKANVQGFEDSCSAKIFLFDYLKDKIYYDSLSQFK